jgi:hypothetical protein
MKRNAGICGIAAALVLIAGIIGTSSAAAAPTFLCPTNLASCTGSNYPSGSTFTIKGTVFFGGGFTCGSTINFKTVVTSGSPLKTETTGFTGFTFTGCTPSTCIVEAKNLPYELNIDAIGGGNGVGKIIRGVNWAEFEVSGCQPHCLYKASAALPESITGGKVAIFKSSGGILTGSGLPGCGTELRPSMVHESEKSLFVTN